MGHGTRDTGSEQLAPSTDLGTQIKKMAHPLEKRRCTIQLGSHISERIALGTLQGQKVPYYVHSTSDDVTERVIKFLET